MRAPCFEIPHDLWVLRQIRAKVARLQGRRPLQAVPSLPLAQVGAWRQVNSPADPRHVPPAQLPPTRWEGPGRSCTQTPGQASCTKAFEHCNVFPLHELEVELSKLLESPSGVAHSA